MVPHRKLEPRAESVVDPRVAEKLISDVCGSAEIVCRLRADFVSAWTGRLERTRDALGADDVDDLEVVLLSIRSASQMVGAAELERIARHMQCYASAGQLEACWDSLPALADVGQRTVAELIAVE